ncbi:transcriptional repressor C-terminal [Nonomuraea maritima]|uniref:Transcriptional repressor C-terminal n=1 Tax=Nonomuraea maritima TaxID=683260 RepID=A0A1G9EBR8_9ACTN|nr:TetR-like C-terminal domain-containing protein [Nonomuraea maritima]SDK73556.1 transcriptional repressor C-terminal [Nonomuraea maritima]
MLSEQPDGGGSALPDTGDLEAELKTVLRATITELNDPRYDEPMRALNTEITHDPALAALYAERLDRPMRELKKQRLRSAQRAGQLAEDVDLDVAVDRMTEWRSADGRVGWCAKPGSAGRVNPSR